MGQSVSKIKDFTVKCGELLPVFRYKRLATEQSRTILELEKVVLSQKTEIEIMSNEWRRISELEEKVKSQTLELGVREKLSEISQSMVDVCLITDFGIPKCVSPNWSPSSVSLGAQHPF